MEVFQTTNASSLSYIAMENELQTFHTQDLSFLRTKGPYGELSFPGNESSRNFRSRALSFSGTFVPGERNYESSWELSFLGPFVHGNFRSHYPIGLVAALLCVLNYCMFGCDFTLMVLTPLWTSQLTLYVGRPAFAARLSVFVCQLASSHLFTLHSYLTEKKQHRTHLKLTQFIFGKQTLLDLLRNKFWQLL